jgi:predicted ribosome quality control (RQC) complex YloA/Tae2 family protein
MAREEDIWLHAKDIPGAHVIIRTVGKEAPPATLMEAAGLAALFSKARKSRHVPVDYTLKKHVHKPKGARPGMVIYEHQKTIMATPDEELPERLSPLRLSKFNLQVKGMSPWYTRKLPDK